MRRTYMATKLTQEEQLELLIKLIKKSALICKDLNFNGNYVILKSILIGLEGLRK